jgi:hypothetical protein
MLEAENATLIKQNRFRQRFLLGSSERTKGVLKFGSQDALVQDPINESDVIAVLGRSRVIAQSIEVETTLPTKFR